MSSLRMGILFRHRCKAGKLCPYNEIVVILPPSAVKRYASQKGKKK